MAGAASAEELPLLEEVAVRQREFDDAMSADDTHRALRSALDLGDLLLDRSRDLEPSDHIDRAHTTLRSMMTRLAETGVEANDPADGTDSEVG